MKRQNVGLARGLRHRMTDAERALWRHVRGRRFSNWKFRRQHALGGFIVAFVCLEARLIVELDGGQHVEQSSQDAERTCALACEGFCVLRFWNDDVLIRVDAVLEKILACLDQLSPHPDPPPAGEREQGATHGRGRA